MRFEHIENCAKEAVQKWQEFVAEERTQKRRAEDDAAESAKLIRVLVERDQSIGILRTLALEKEEKANQAKDAEVAPELDHNGTSQTDGNAVQQTKEALAGVKPTIDYSAMTLLRLKALEKARDATLSFLLKRIDKAEANIAAVADLEAAPT